MDIRNCQRTTKADPALIRRAVAAALDVAGVPGREVSVALVGDRRMRVLNRDFRGKDRTTDVLAFPLAEGDYLGEVVVSMETCRRQASEAGRPLKEELAELVIHGVLHLAGHDHELGPGKAREMGRLQMLAMGRLGVGVSIAPPRSKRA